MIALTMLGVICLILFCMAIPLTLIVDVYIENKFPKVGRDGKRELKINRIYFWDYLILIIPTCLILIGLFTNNPEERATSFWILGFGYMLLILSSYNRRIEIPKINWSLFTVCLTCLITGYFLQNFSNEFNHTLNESNLKPLYFPAIAFVYIHASRVVIKKFTNTFPISLDRNLKLGFYYSRYLRKTNVGDLIWSLINLTVIPILIMFFINF